MVREVAPPWTEALCSWVGSPDLLPSSSSAGPPLISLLLTLYQNLYFNASRVKGSIAGRFKGFILGDVLVLFQVEDSLKLEPSQDEVSMRKKYGAGRLLHHPNSQFELQISSSLYFLIG